ncbi:prolyl oligopeptidase family serine peptidase [Aliiglaciecola sp. CAU 1673]|uniref:alpha/beta hydrolase family protein n=1 Tax=Aliiglaciecola sp. CAU 1673 TaxID=3032595 RepID=UPI0023DBD03D|nr:prolyl oligopeptidase family serine peptidase [Aliiglaciecola sp. CAU 1673]MDF2178404.1 prolyl oligopeptidase family serine peptidase [Aliiglaciecola sp. CAU 1673]
MLLIHGDEDRIVPVKHSQDMAKELQNTGGTVRYVELPKGNHSLELEENRLLTLKELESFLSTHL